jgi:hypothetical protein
MGAAVYAIFYWLLKTMLPDVYALFFAGDEAPQQTEELRKQSQGQTPLIHEEGLPIIPGSLALDPKIACYHKKVCGYDSLGDSHDSQY